MGRLISGDYRRIRAPIVVRYRTTSNLVSTPAATPVSRRMISRAMPGLERESTGVCNIDPRHREDEPREPSADSSISNWDDCVTSFHLRNATTGVPGGKNRGLTFGRVS